MTFGLAASRTATTEVSILPKATSGKLSKPWATSELKTDIRWNGTGRSRWRFWVVVPWYDQKGDSSCPNEAFCSESAATCPNEAFCW